MPNGIPLILFIIDLLIDPNISLTYSTKPLPKSVLYWDLWHNELIYCCDKHISSSLIQWLINGLHEVRFFILLFFYGHWGDFEM